VRDRLDLALEDLGEIEVKNIKRPVRAFRVTGVGEEKPPAASPRRRNLVYALASAVLILVVAGGIWKFQHDPGETAAGTGAPSGQGLSIAVLPFSGLSDDKAQAYFADGITEDITTDLSKVAGLYVTSRTATLRYRNGAQDLKVIASALGVGHVLTGSVRRAGDKLRRTATFIDA
jgi:adenylate cyclase